MVKIRPLKQKVSRKRTYVADRKINGCQTAIFDWSQNLISSSLHGNKYMCKVWLESVQPFNSYRANKLFGRTHGRTDARTHARTHARTTQKQYASSSDERRHNKWAPDSHLWLEPCQNLISPSTLGTEYFSKVWLKCVQPINSYRANKLFGRTHARTDGRTLGRTHARTDNPKQYASSSDERRHKKWVILLILSILHGHLLQAC